MHHLAPKEHTMFVTTRSKTAGIPRPSATVRPISEAAPVLNHWAWTGWMPEAEHEAPQPALPVADHNPELLAA